MMNCSAHCRAGHDIHRRCFTYRYHASAVGTPATLYHCQCWPIIAFAKAPNNMDQLVDQLTLGRLAHTLSHTSFRRSNVIALLSSATLLAFVGPALFKLSRAFLHQYRSPLRFVPGPKSSNFLLGNLVEIGDWIDVATSRRTIEQWTETFGPNFRCKLFFNVSRSDHPLRHKRITNTY